MTFAFSSNGSPDVIQGREGGFTHPAKIDLAIVWLDKVAPPLYSTAFRNVFTVWFPSSLLYD